MFIHKWRTSFIEMFEKAFQLSTVIDDVLLNVLNNHGVKGFAVFLPVLGCANDTGALFRRNRSTLLRRYSLHCGMPLELAPGIETPREQVGSRDGGHCWIREKNQGNEEIFRTYKHRAPRPNFTGGFKGSRHPGKMRPAGRGFASAR